MMWSMIEVWAGKANVISRIRYPLLLRSVFGSIIFADYMAPWTPVIAMPIDGIVVLKTKFIVDVDIFQVNQSFSQYLPPDSIAHLGWEAE